LFVHAATKVKCWPSFSPIFPERLSSLKSIYLRKDAGEPKRVGLQNFWIDRNHPGQGVFHFEGCGSISEAESLRGLDVLLPSKSVWNCPQATIL